MSKKRNNDIARGSKRMNGKKTKWWTDGCFVARVVENRRIVGGCEGGGSPTETGRALWPSSDAAEVWGAFCFCRYRSMQLIK